MARCPSCDYPLPNDRDRLGARCPGCRDPIYEPAGRLNRPAREHEATCPVHPGMESVGVCARCGNYLCEVCRTRWRGQILCVACVDRALATQEATPEQSRSHFRQALWALLLGAGAWGLSALSILMLAAVASSSQAGPGGAAILLILVCFFIVAGDVLVAALGMGQAVAALRSRGDHMILATLGLVLGGLYIGAFMGLLLFNIWQSG